MCPKVTIFFNLIMVCERSTMKLTVLLFSILLFYMAHTTEGAWNYIRLRGGVSNYSGRVEVKIAGAWGQICGRYWSRNDAIVACRQLGFDGARNNSPKGVNTSSRPSLLLGNVQCNGTEATIFDCKSVKDPRQFNCRIKNAATVNCIPPSQRPIQDASPCLSNQFLCKGKNMCIPQAWRCNGRNDCGDREDELSCQPTNNVPSAKTAVRLVGSNLANEGRLEVFYARAWGTVCDDGFRQRSANVVCRQLGFTGSLRVYRNTTQVQKGHIWMDNVKCNGTESSIFDCRGNSFGINDCVHSEDVWITCQPLKGCGVQQFPIIESSHRIVGGQAVARGSWPWQASILLTFPTGNKEPFCGGVLVEKQWVLTAAHCFDNMKGTSWRGIRIRLGDYNMHINDGTEQEFRIQKLVKHPLYRNRSHLADLALIKLDRQANTVSRYVQTICLPDTNTKPFNGSDYCFVTGWGDTRGTGNKNILQQARVPIYSYMACRRMYGRKLYPGMMCAGYDMGAKDACQGDSGGPLMCKIDNHWMVAGIVSWGEGCGVINKPGVYTEVTTYINWILNVIYPPATAPYSSHIFG